MRSSKMVFSILLVTSMAFARHPSPNETSGAHSHSESTGASSSTSSHSHQSSDSKHGSGSSHNTSKPTPPHHCQRGEIWTDLGCKRIVPCGRGEISNGTDCILDDNQCHVDPFRADELFWALHGARDHKKVACAKDPRGQECEELTQRYEELRRAYRELYNFPPGCGKHLNKQPSADDAVD
jgi:hypothetical protein